MTTLITRYALVFVIAGIVILAATGNLLSSSIVVIAVQLLAVGINLWARGSFPKKTFRVDATPATEAIIRRGPYRLIRHPMYAAVLLFIWAAVLSHLAPLTVIVGAFVTLIAARRIVLEERFLCQRYPDYAVYAQATKAVIPYLI